MSKIQILVLTGTVYRPKDLSISISSSDKFPVVCSQDVCPVQLLSGLIEAEELGCGGR